MRLSIYIFIALILVSFQNCGQQVNVERAVHPPSAGASGNLKVSADIQPRDDASGLGYDPSIPKAAILAPRDPLAVTHLAQPLTVDFASTVAGTDATSGVWGMNRFVYRLVLMTGKIYTLQDHQEVYQLSVSERAEINAMFASAALDIAGNYLSFDRACAMVLNPAYASLGTNYGIFDLGTGTSACTAVDLYRADKSGLFGLQAFLQALQLEVDSQSGAGAGGGGLTVNP